MPRKSRARAAPYLLLSPTLCVLLTFAIFPLFFAIYLALHAWDFGAPLSTMRYVAGGNFVHALIDPLFWVSIRNTVIFLIFAVGGEFILGYALASLVASRRHGMLQRIIRALKPLILLPMIVTPVVVALLWRQMYNVDLGLVNYLLSFLGVRHQAWLTNTRLVLGVVIFTDIWEWTPFMFLIFLSGLTALPEEPLESASVDGANRIQILLHITLPAMSPLIFVAVSLRSIDVFKIFDLPFVMTSGGPGNATEVISLFAYRQGFMKSDIGYGSAVALILTVLVTIAGTLAVRTLYREGD